MQKDVLKYVKRLSKHELKGVSGKLFAQFTGCISSEDLEIMKNEIELACEKVDKNEW
ncbi:MAG: hypothetical protein HQM10_24820 [Candidatus Riflebacteria bacterium]|nr:hypothetical protein [Candidatus Riflebacteria bacterium]